jgi:hypothetical protein
MVINNFNFVSVAFAPSGFLSNEKSICVKKTTGVMKAKGEAAEDGRPTHLKKKSRSKPSGSFTESSNQTKQQAA